MRGAYLRRALERVARTLPSAGRVELAGLGHGGSGNAVWSGRPTVVAGELLRFFG